MDAGCPLVLGLSSAINAIRFSTLNSLPGRRAQRMETMVASLMPISSFPCRVRADAVWWRPPPAAGGSSVVLRGGADPLGGGAGWGGGGAGVPGVLVGRPRDDVHRSVPGSEREDVLLVLVSGVQRLVRADMQVWQHHLVDRCHLHRD